MIQATVTATGASASKAKTETTAATAATAETHFPFGALEGAELIELNPISNQLQNNDQSSTTTTTEEPDTRCPDFDETFDIYRKQLADHVEFFESSVAVINGAQFEVVLNGKVHGHTVGLRYPIILPNEAYAWYSTSNQRVVRQGIEEDVVIAHKVVAALKRNQQTRGQSPDEVIFYCRSSP